MIIQTTRSNKTNDRIKEAIQKVAENREKENTEKLKASYAASKAKLKGMIDPSLLGSWKFNKRYTPAMGKPYEITAIYTFFANGKFEYYLPNAYSVTDQSKNTFPGEWRVDGDTLLLLIPGTDTYVIEKKLFKKKTNSSNGRQTLVIQFRDTEYRDYESIESK